jgi:hypothetical protein
MSEDQVLVVKFAPKLRRLSNRQEGDVDHQGRKVVEPNAEVLWRALWMLIMLVTQLAC